MTLYIGMTHLYWSQAHFLVWTSWHEFLLYLSRHSIGVIGTSEQIPVRLLYSQAIVTIARQARDWLRLLASEHLFPTGTYLQPLSHLQY